MGKILLVSIVVILVLVLGVSISFPFIEKRSIDEAKRLIMQNEKFEEVFGEVSKVRLWPLGRYEWNDKFSNFPLSVKGSKQKGLVKVYCIKANDNVRVTKITQRYGFADEIRIWPVTIYSKKGAKIPANIWNGIEFLLGSIILYVLYLNPKSKGWFSRNVLIKLFGSATDKVTILTRLWIPILLLISLLYFTNIMYS